MKYMRQLGIILGISFLGEGLKYLIPLPVPGSIYGLVLLFLALHFKKIPLDAVEASGNFLLGIMTMMFIPAGAGLINNVESLRGSLGSLAIIILVSTVVVFGVSGKVAEALLERDKKK